MYAANRCATPSLLVIRQCSDVNFLSIKYAFIVRRPMLEKPMCNAKSYAVSISVGVWIWSEESTWHCVIRSALRMLCSNLVGTTPALKTAKVYSIFRLIFLDQSSGCRYVSRNYRNFAKACGYRPKVLSAIGVPECAYRGV